MLKLDCLTVKVYYMCVQLTSSLVCNVVLSGKVCFPPISFTFGERLLLQDPIEAQSLHQAMNLVQGSCNHSYTHLRFCQRHLWSRFFFFFFKAKLHSVFTGSEIGFRQDAVCVFFHWCISQMWITDSFSPNHFTDVWYFVDLTWMNTVLLDNIVFVPLCYVHPWECCQVTCYATQTLFMLQDLNLFTFSDPCTSLPVYLLSLQKYI